MPNFNASTLSAILLIYGILFGVELLIFYPIFACFKWLMLRRIGMPRDERKLVFSNRERYFNLEYFVDRYGDRQLRVVDGLSRKLLHIVSGIWQLAILNVFIKDTEIALIATLTYQIFVLGLSIISYHSNKIFGLAGLMYGASSRIRDGIYGRKNLFAARCSFLNLIPLAYIDHVARTSIPDSSRLVLFSFFVFLPLTVGDALGELIGTTWGKQKLYVWGIGQINRKSLLGTSAVFLGSLIPLLIVTYLNHLPLPWWILALTISAATTLIELAAPRGTDNFFIPVGNASLCLAFALRFLASG
ncbi:MAG: hypothetical protein AAFQ40_00465 [Cyanobacteria bacterium J06623_5]